MPQSGLELHDHFSELMALPLGEFAEATKNISPSPCIPGFEPKALLLIEEKLQHIQTNDLQDWLRKEYLDGSRIFSGWLRLALIQADLDVPQEDDRPSFREPQRRQVEGQLLFLDS
jgi:hypothetical protein